MSVSFVSNALGATNSTTSFSITLPATQAGDIIVLEFTHRGTGDGTIGGTYNGGALALKHSQLFATSTFSGKTYWGRATGDHAGQTITGASLTNSSAAIVTIYRGGRAVGDPLTAATIVGEQNASGNETQAEITTTVDGAWVVLVVANSPDVAVTSPACTSPGALTSRAERLSTGGTDTAIAHASAEKATAGATGAFTWAQTNGAGGSWAYAILPENSPTVALNSPADAGSTSDTTPDLLFTGTDTEGDAIRYQVEVSTTGGGYDVASNVFTQIALSVAGQMTLPASFLFNGNGTKLYVLDNSTATIYEYGLSSAYDVATATYTGTALVVSGQEVDAFAMIFNGDGTKLYVAGATGQDINEYALSSAYDIATATFTQIALSLAAVETSPQCLAFNGDGTVLYVVGITADRVQKYTLSTAYDIATATYTAVALDPTPQGGTPRGIFFNNDGTKFYVIDSSDDEINEYALSTPYDVSTATFTQVALSFGVDETAPREALFNNDGTKIYTLGSGSDNVREYAISGDTIVINAVSDTDPGFSGSPDNTDPFTSAQAVTYTVQTALSAGTYYWRVRAIDPSGSNAYGAWSSTRSFTVTASGPSPLVADAGSFTLTGVANALTRALALEATTATFTLTGVAATLSKVYVMVAEPAAFTVTTVEASFLRSYQVTCDTGTFSLSGVATGVYFNHVVVADTASFTLTGVSAELAKGYILTADQATFTVTTIDAIFLPTHVLVAETGAFAVTGIATDLLRQYAIVADQASYTLTGYASDFPRANVMLASTGVFTLTGVDAELPRSYQLVAEPATFTLTGIDAVTAYNRVLDTETASFTLSTVEATFTRSYVLVASQGAFTMTGVDAQTVKTFAISADTGTLTLSTVSAVVARGVVMEAETATFTVTGVANSFSWAHVISATTATFTLTGIDSAFERALIMAVDTGVFTLTGVSVSFERALVMPVSVGTFTLTGVDTPVLAQFRLDAETESYTLTGTDAAIEASDSFDAFGASFEMAGNDAELTKHFVLQAETAAFTVTGGDATFQKVFILIAETASYAVTPVAIAFIKHSRIEAEPALFTGPDSSADFLIDHVVSVDSGSFELLGVDISTVFGRSFDVSPGAFTLAGTAIDFSLFTPDITDPFTPDTSPFTKGTRPFTDGTSPFTKPTRPFTPREPIMTRPPKQY